MTVKHTQCSLDDSTENFITYSEVIHGIDELGINIVPRSCISRMRVYNVCDPNGVRRIYRRSKSEKPT